MATDLKEMLQLVVTARSAFSEEELLNANRFFVEEIKYRRKRRDNIAKAALAIGTPVRHGDGVLGFGKVTDIRGRNAIVRFDSRPGILYRVPCGLLTILTQEEYLDRTQFANHPGAKV